MSREIPYISFHLILIIYDLQKYKKCNTTEVYIRVSGNTFALVDTEVADLCERGRGLKNVRSDTHSGVVGKVHVVLKEGNGDVLVNT
jgi:hypothetical protein